jgi:hypothetical protein
MQVENEKEREDSAQLAKVWIKLSIRFIPLNALFAGFAVLLHWPNISFADWAFLVVAFSALTCAGFAIWLFGLNWLKSRLTVPLD